MKTTEQHRNVVVRYVFLTIGAISFALGTAGIVLPLLPTVPFYMLTLFCLARGSERLHKMFWRLVYIKRLLLLMNAIKR